MWRWRCKLVSGEPTPSSATTEEPTPFVSGEPTPSSAATDEPTPFVSQLLRHSLLHHPNSCANIRPSNRKSNNCYSKRSPIIEPISYAYGVVKSCYQLYHQLQYYQLYHQLQHHQLCHRLVNHLSSPPLWHQPLNPPRHPRINCPIHLLLAQLNLPKM